MNNFSFFGFFPILIMLLFWGISIYALVLFILLGHKGLKALDIYIKKHKDVNM